MVLVIRASYSCCCGKGENKEIENKDDNEDNGNRNDKGDIESTVMVKI